MGRRKENITRLFLIFFIFLTCSAYGQTKNKKVERDTTRQWEIGLDLLWLIDKNQVPSTSIFARYNFTKDKSKKRALRFRLGVNTNLYDSTQIVNPQDNEIDIFAPYIRPGFEWQQAINDKTSYFYGIDLSVLYYQNKFKKIIYPGPNLFQGTYKTWELGAVGFIGFKYKPTKWIALSVESSFNLIYRIRRDEDKVTDINFPNDPGGRGKIDVNDLTVSFTPITVVNISYFLNHRKL
jgi:hypothetical protein